MLFAPRLPERAHATFKPDRGQNLAAGPLRSHLSHRVRRQVPMVTWRPYGLPRGGFGPVEAGATDAQRAGDGVAEFYAAEDTRVAYAVRESQIICSNGA